jgi:SSS family solute:Na+ symporter
LILTTIIIVYLVILLAVGFWANRYNKDMTDFILAGRRLGLGLGTFTIAATYFGGGYVLGLGEAAYQNGLVVWWFGIGGGLGLILTGFLAGKVRAMNIYTIPDFLERRYGGRLFRPLIAIITIITYTGILASQILATKAALSIVGLGTMKAAAVASLVFIVYAAVGGLWAATITDFIQLIVASGGIIAAFTAVLWRLGGWGGFVSAIQLNINKSTHGFFNVMGTGDWSYIIWLAAPILLTTLAGADTYQRLLATKDAKTAQRSCWLAGIIIIIITAFPTLIGMSAHAFFPGLNDASAALPNVVGHVFSPVLAGIVMAAILAAIMSTADSLLTVGTANIVYDIMYKTLHREEELDEKKMLTISRVAVVIMGLIAVIVAALSSGIIDLINFVAILNTGGIVVPVVGGILWKRANLKAGLSAFFFGITAAAMGLSGVTFAGIPTEIFGILVSLVVFIVVTLVTTKKGDELLVE